MSKFQTKHLKEIYESLKEYTCFSVKGDHIHVLNTPNEFYNRLKEYILSSKFRIVISSLYLVGH